MIGVDHSNRRACKILTKCRRHNFRFSEWSQFRNISLQIPGFDKVAVKKDETTVLLESNVEGFPMWVAQFRNRTSFGEHTNEIRKFALEKKEVSKIVLQRHS
jgi:hypothetical protein